MIQIPGTQFKNKQRHETSLLVSALRPPIEACDRQQRLCRRMSCCSTPTGWPRIPQCTLRYTRCLPLPLSGIASSLLNRCPSRSPSPSRTASPFQASPPHSGRRTISYRPPAPGPPEEMRLWIREWVISCNFALFLL